jgi:hypothetical protein
MVVRSFRVPSNFGSGPHDRQAAITLSGAREDDELLGRAGHRDIAIDRAFDAFAECLDSAGEFVR